MKDNASDLKDHLEKAESNQRFLNSFDLYRTGFLDWAIVAIFYTALHYVDAYLASKGHVEIAGGHQERNSLVREQLSSIESQYMTLYWASRNARYIPDFRPTSGKVIKYKRYFLLEIKSYIMSLLKNPPG